MNVNYDVIKDLVSPDCDVAATMRFAEAHRDDDVKRLSLRRFPAGVDRLMALQQIAGYGIARHKLPQWAATDGIVYPPRVSMEQCSSQTTAQFKAALVVGDTLVDLTGGFGVDCSYMARGCKAATYVERNERLVLLARHNFAALGLNHITVCHAAAEDFMATMPPVDTIFIDPSRRDNAGQRVFAISDCEPDLTQCAPRLLSTARRVIAKLSPMLDVTAVVNALPRVSRIIVLATRGECKELIAVMDRDAQSPPLVECVDDNVSFTFDYNAVKPQVDYWSNVNEKPAYLYDPDVTIMKAGCFAHVAAQYGMRLVAPNSHLMVADRVVADFPGRAFRVIDVIEGIPRKRVPLNQANVAVRNFPLTAVQLRDRLRLRDGGSIYIFGTTSVARRPLLLVAEPLG